MTPKISIVIIGFDMARELPRTVTSFSAPYQRGMQANDIEVIVVDNNSTIPLKREDFPADIDLQLLRVEDGGVSPCKAINHGVRAARAPYVGIVIDGARMASPGVVRSALEAARFSPKAFVATLGFHLGPKVQQVSVTEGYSREVEDGLLNDINWPTEGYRLFEICALGESYRNGVLAAPPETTFFVMDKAHYLEIGGYNEAFVTLGGGLASFDFFDRAVAAAGDDFIMLVGEGTFHQLHYGATTQAGGIRRKAEGEKTLGEIYAQEFAQVVGRPWQVSQILPKLYGRLTHPATRNLFFPAVA
jgi:glycosyltransferase involved in cell wall biosynthesis